MTSMVAKVSQRSLGNPQMLIADEKNKNENKFFLGTIIGNASGISRRTSPDGEKVHEGLKGTFETIPNSKDVEPVSSGTLYLPEGMVENFLAPFRGEKPPTAVDIAIEVYVVRAKNPQGYSWELNPLIAQESENDPLKSVREKLAKAATKKK